MLSVVAMFIKWRYSPSRNNKHNNNNANSNNNMINDIVTNNSIHITHSLHSYIIITIIMISII